jgi:hypothetical protein
MNLAAEATQLTKQDPAVATLAYLMGWSAAFTQPATDLGV